MNEFIDDVEEREYINSLRNWQSKGRSPEIDVGRLAAVDMGIEVTSGSFDEDDELNETMNEISGSRWDNNFE
jgi:hypothetical protein